MIELVGLVVVVVPCVLLCSWIRGRNRKSIPGPSGYPVCGNLYQIERDRIHQNLKVYSEEYGPIFKIRIFSANIITLTSSKLIQKVFGTPPTDSVTNDRSSNSTKDVFYDRKHIGCANLSEETKRLRNFHKHDIQHYFDGKNHFEVIMKDEMKRLHLRLIGSPGKDRNPHSDLRIYFKNICSLLLIGTIIPEEDPDRGILWEFIDMLYVMIDPSVDGPLKMFPFLRHLPGYYGDVYRQTIAARNKVGKRLFDDQKASYVPGRIRGLVDVCIKTQQEDIARSGDSWLTDEYIKGLVYDTLAAGMTELMKTLRLFILLMCHYPDVQARLQTEIDRVIGTERFPTGTDSQWMPYTQAVMLEVWRYGSQTPLGIPHMCSSDVIVDDYLIEKGSLIFANLYGVHHDQTIWGDPWQFRPDRFLDHTGNLLSRDHTLMRNVIPFSLGKRACPGQDFARSRTFIGMTSLLQRVSITPALNSALPSADPRQYTKNYPLTEPKFDCRFVSRENIVI